MGTPAYDRENTRRVNIKLNKKTDADIIQYLEQIKETEGIQGLFKRAIRTMSQQQAKEYPPTRYSETLYGCGACGMELTGKPHYCGNCGQAIKWTK